MRSLCIVPVYNQVTELPAFIEKCRKDLACDSLLFVDDGSSDGSTELIVSSGFDYLINEKRTGIGYALIRGTKHAIEKGFEIIVHMAGNGKMVPEEMNRVLDPIKSGEYDYVWGSRFLPGGRFENAPKFRKYGIPFVFNQIPLLFTGKKLTDSTCGFRAYRISILTEIAKGWDHPWLNKYEFEYFVLAKVLLSQYRYKEVPISMIYPSTKRSYSKITPIISWWSMLKPWIVVGLRLDAFFGTTRSDLTLPEPLSVRSLPRSKQSP